MARCCGDNCLCKLQDAVDTQGDPSILLTGTGSAMDPFLVAFAGLQVADTASINLTLSFQDDGYHLSAAFGAGSKINQLGDVMSLAPLNGQVLAWDELVGQWIPINPPTAAPGAVLTATSIEGDGSGPAPLAVAFDEAGGLQDAGFGIGLSDDAVNALVRHFADETARDGALVAPVLNALCTLDNYPGLVWWYNGTEWDQLVRIIDTIGVEYIPFSGGYLDGPLTIMVMQLNTVTDDTGMFTMWTAADLAGYNGVMSVQVQPTGDVPWIAILPSTPTTDVTGFAYIPSDPDPQPSFAVTGIVTALLY